VDDIRQLLAHLGLRRVVHVGTSGGGPYACACAALAPATTAGLHLVASMTHCSGPGSGHLMHGMSAVDRLGFACIAHAPCAAALALALAAPAMAWLPTLARLLAAPAHVGGVVGCAAGAGGRAALWLLLSTLPASDRRALLSQPGEVLQVLPQMLADSMRHGSRGLMQDMRRTTLPWGEFDLHSIRAPTVVHQGDADVNVPLNMGRHLAAHIPDAQLRVVPGAAHFSLVLEHAPTIVADIAARCSARGSV
jgi:pimeloyl-ACP methyl ester carboxylesterase